VGTRVVSMPSVEWSEEQSAEYRESVLPTSVKAVWRSRPVPASSGTGTSATADASSPWHVVGVVPDPSVLRAETAYGKESWEGDDEQPPHLAARRVTAGEAVRTMTTADVRTAVGPPWPADDGTGGRGGRIFVGTGPHPVQDTTATAAETRQPAWLTDRPKGVDEE